MATISSLEAIVNQWVDELSRIDIDVDQDRVIITCVDPYQANDVANSVALLLADKLVGWRRVLENIPDADEHSKRLREKFDRLAQEREVK